MTTRYLAGNFESWFHIWWHHWRRVETAPANLTFEITFGRLRLSLRWQG